MFKTEYILFSTFTLKSAQNNFSNILFFLETTDQTMYFFNFLLREKPRNINIEDDISCVVNVAFSTKQSNLFLCF